MTLSTKEIETIDLPIVALGNRRTLQIVRYGPKITGKKTYIQAGLHADEPPGFVVMHYLLKLLDEEDKENKIEGEIILVPVANPIGLNQWSGNQLQGRFDVDNGVNFNRNYPELTEGVARQVASKLQSDANKNITLIRKAMLRVLAEQSPMDEGAFLKQKLLSLAVDADIVLDLHCDDDASLHIYMGTPLWPDATDLSAQLGSKVTLLAKNSGGEPFDEACSKPWWELASRFPERPIPPACLAATVELRGSQDVSHELGQLDAKNIFTFLKRRGYIKGKAPKLPKLARNATPLSGVEHVKATAPGIIIYRKNIGDLIKKGDVVAEIINPLAQKTHQRIIRLKAKNGGVLFTKLLDRYAKNDRVIIKIAGKKPIKSKGKHLLTL